jgi:hypothetical protein
MTWPSPPPTTILSAATARIVLMPFAQALTLNASDLFLT